MSTYKERRLERKRYRRTRFGIWIGRVVAIIIFAIALVSLFTTSQKVESLPQKELGRVETVPAPKRPEPKPLQELLDQRAEKEIAASPDARRKKQLHRLGRVLSAQFL